MKLFIKHIWFIGIVFSTTVFFAQENDSETIQPRFSVRGSVIESDTRDPIPNVNIEVNGGGYTTTDMFGDFRIQSKKGDELTIRHKDFETVYYTIQSNERIIVEVQPNKSDNYRSKFLKSRIPAIKLGIVLNCVDFKSSPLPKKFFIFRLLIR